MNWDTLKNFLADLTLQKLLPAIVILLIGFLLVKLLMKLLDKVLSRSKLDKTAFTILKSCVKVLLYTLVLLIAAGSLGIDVTSLVAIVSVISLAISLAVQSLLANVVSGVMLLTSHPFRVGDHVQLGTDSGIVKEIGLYYTKIDAFSGEMICIPNSDAASARICNYSVEAKRRIELTVSAAYAEDADKVKEAILAAAKHEKILPDPGPMVYLSECGASSVNYLLHLWVKAEDYATVKFAVTEAIKKRFDEEGITMPFPQLDVHMSN